MPQEAAYAFQAHARLQQVSCYRVTKGMKSGFQWQSGSLYQFLKPCYNAVAMHSFYPDA